MDGTPSIDTIWNSLIGSVPGPYRSIVLIGITIFVVASALAKLVEQILNIRDRVRRRQAQDVPPAIGPEGPPSNSKSFWLKDGAKNPTPPKLCKDGGIPIISVSNMKGGVGKTTVSANLAAYFDQRNLRVLLIDFDYQGSLSQTVLSAAQIGEFPSIADDLVKGEKPAAALIEESRALGDALPNSRIFTSYYEFSNTEILMISDWVSGVRQEIRYNLSKTLSSDLVQAEFDLVLIDTGPRFMTSTINALCASTHVLIPTILDGMSARAVAYYSKEIARLRSLFPQLRLLGVVPTFISRDPPTARRPQFSNTEMDAISQLKREVGEVWGKEFKSAILEVARIPDRSEIAAIAGKGIAYLDPRSDARRTFGRLGDILCKRLEDEGFRLSR